MDNSLKMSYVDEHNVNGPRKKGNGPAKTLYKDDGKDEGNEDTQSESNLFSDPVKSEKEEEVEVFLDALGGLSQEESHDSSDLMRKDDPVEQNTVLGDGVSPMHQTGYN